MENDSSYGQVIRLPRRAQSQPRDVGVLASRAALSDVIATRPTDPAATGFVLSLLTQADGPILWVQDYRSRRENGHLYTPSLQAFGIDQAVLKVAVSHPRDVLWAMEEGAACAGLSAVVGEIHGGPAALDFTATKRLVMRADATGVPLYLIRSGDCGGLSAARMRWRVATLPSRPHPHDARSPGQPQWDVDLFRARGHPPGRWVVHYDPSADRAADRLRLVSRISDRAVDAPDQPIPNLTGK
ncbi:ImuA family protein [Oceaniglobus ichthyenteri]|uniref:ImuA family protein n=1 Tax=Oceaniglobus ichthyenteri TaxID=2136177 RepID=UPI001F0CA399|nr:hypothetical protein [Oceaniglobus ichthyenteri]